MEDLSGDWRRLDERIEHITKEIEVLAHGSESCRQLTTVPGIGPLIASAMVAAIGNGAAFAKGRDSAEANVDRRSDDPRAHQQARQSLPTHAVHAGRSRYLLRLRIPEKATTLSGAW
jgi:transposase